MSITNQKPRKLPPNPSLKKHPEPSEIQQVNYSVCDNNGQSNVEQTKKRKQEGESAVEHQTIENINNSSSKQQQQHQQTNNSSDVEPSKKKPKVTSEQQQQQRSTVFQDQPQKSQENGNDENSESDSEGEEEEEAVNPKTVFANLGTGDIRKCINQIKKAAEVHGGVVNEMYLLPNCGMTVGQFAIQHLLKHHSKKRKHSPKSANK